MKITKVYTRTGDKGQTSIVGGFRVSKASERLEAYGTVDELSSHLGLLASMLAEGEYPILALTKREFHSLNLSANKFVPAGELPKCVVHKTGYWIPFAEGEAIDPLSTVLSLDADERADPRVSMAIDEMLEKYVKIQHQMNQSSKEQNIHYQH